MTELETRPEPSVSNLVSGILSDVQTLLKQQVEMLRVEVRQDVQRTVRVAKFVGVGAAFGVLGSLFLIISLVHLLAYLAPGLPEFAYWAIVGGSLLLIGGIALFLGKRLFDTFNPLPDKTYNALQENLSWIAKNQN